MRTLGRNRARAAAFTLVETLAVLVILGLLAGVLLVSFSSSVGRGKQELAKTGIGVIVQKLEVYHLEHSAWPSNDIGLAALGDGHATPTAAYYLTPDQLRDPWKQPYAFVTPGPDGHPYEVVTFGRDAQPGGEDEDKDISSTNLGGS